MRVIAGTAKRIGLKSVEGTDLRPLLDRVKEALFSLLDAQGRIDGAQVLDLFAGSGSVGIEALSRGAARAVFVEHSRACVEAINENLRRTRLLANADVICGDVIQALELNVPRARQFDLVFCDPPFAQTAGGLEPDGRLATLAAQRVSPNGLLIVRSEYKHGQPQPDRLGSLARLDTRTWGRSEVMFYGSAVEDRP